MSNVSLSENIFSPLPLKELSQNMKKKHDRWLPVVNELFDDFIKSNGDKFASLYDLFIKAMEAELDIYTFTNRDYLKFQKNMDELDKRFSHVHEFISKLSPEEFKKMMTTKYFRTVKILKRNAVTLRNDLLQKDVWNENDGIIYTYYMSLSHVLSVLVTELDEASPEDGVDLIPLISIISIVYGAVILAYLQDKLKPEVLIERLSELATFSDIPPVKTSKKIREVLKNSRKVPVI